ncbi:prepilin-type N-terminal cleavage/methylation domain-containing protein [Cryobacterium sp. TMT2-10]|uniref:type IV pilus modification PilV family protein n=1 Tax=Cryobacterium sp. TMT2-10 TaxID=1259244 RepID=UPI00141A92FD|nr:type II secretion system protein [Cryobacterium sp. TMT2-10]
MNTANRRHRPIVLEDSGLGLIEIMVSMMLLAVISLAVLPTLIGSIKATSQNATIATASQLLSQQLEEARSRDSRCAALANFAAETIAPVVDGRGVSLQPKRDPIVCPSTYPGTVRVRISVVVSGTTQVLASAVSLIFVKTGS